MPRRNHVGLLTQAGGSHLSAYYESLAKTDEIESVSLADPSGNAEAPAKAALGSKLTKVYRDYGELLKQEEPLMALVSMEGVTAPPVIDLALESGCHVFAEKPSCTRAEHFAPLVEKADTKHLYLMLALANRISPPIAAAREMIRRGTIGKIYGQEMHWIADQTRLHKPGYEKQWVAQKSRAGGGNLIWLGIHWLDLAMYLPGSPVEEVSAFIGNVGGARLDVEDSSAIAMRFANGTFGTLTSGYYLDKGYHSHIKIWGSQGWIHLEPRSAIPLTWQTPGDSKNPGVQEYTGPKEPTGYTPFVRACFRACQGTGELPITAKESLHVLKTVFACYKSGETGQRVKV
jgi:predicted dehydrogenase